MYPSDFRIAKAFVKHFVEQRTAFVSFSPLNIGLQQLLKSVLENEDPYNGNAAFK